MAFLLLISVIMLSAHHTYTCKRPFPWMTCDKPSWWWSQQYVGVLVPCAEEVMPVTCRYSSVPQRTMHKWVTEL